MAGRGVAGTAPFLRRGRGRGGRTRAAGRGPLSGRADVGAGRGRRGGGRAQRGGVRRAPPPPRPAPLPGRRSAAMPGSIYQPEGGQAPRGPPRCLALLSPPPPAGQEPPPPEPEREGPPAQDEAAALRFALDQFSLLGLEEAGERGLRAAEAGGAGPEEPEAAAGGVGPGGLQARERGGSPPAPGTASPPAAFGNFAPHLAPPAALLAEPLGSRKKSVNMTECVPVPSSEHVAEIVGRQGNRRPAWGHPRGPTPLCPARGCGAAFRGTRPPGPAAFGSVFTVLGLCLRSEAET